jgi:hypothetical protein
MSGTKGSRDERIAWVARMLGVNLPAANAAKGSVEEALARFDSDPETVAPALRKAAAALMASFPVVQSEMQSLMQELDDDDLGAIDRAAALSRLGELRRGLQAQVDALRAAA